MHGFAASFRFKHLPSSIRLHSILLIHRSMHLKYMFHDLSRGLPKLVENHWPLELGLAGCFRTTRQRLDANGVRRWMSFALNSRVFPWFYRFSRLANFGGHWPVVEKCCFRCFGDRAFCATTIIIIKSEAADTSKTERNIESDDNDVLCRRQACRTCCGQTPTTTKFTQFGFSFILKMF